MNRVLKISKIFINKGVKPKDRIAIISENRKEYLEIEMACAKIGAILVAINWRLSDNEINYCINLVKPKLVILSLKFKNHKKLDSIKTQHNKLQTNMETHLKNIQITAQSSCKNDPLKFIINRIYLLKKKSE